MSWDQLEQKDRPLIARSQQSISSGPNRWSHLTSGESSGSSQPIGTDEQSDVWQRDFWRLRASLMAMGS